MWVGQQPARLGGTWAASEPRPLILGHRGARHAAPENTFAAFDLALKEGAEGVELDVRLNASGEVVVLHDADLKRVTGGRDARKLSRLKSDACRQVRLEQGERLPLLSEVLDWARRHGARVNVEIKADDPRAWLLVRAVARLTRAATDLHELLLVSCFHPAFAWAFCQLAPEVPTAWLVESMPLLRAPLRWQRSWSALHPGQKLVSAERAQAWKAAGMRLHVWTVNDPERALELARWGVDALISDNPGRLLQALHGRPASEPAAG
jgi:glycerophosphoryl diester phosphodiesterase